MHIWINTVKGKSIKLEVEDTSETIDIKIHGDTTRKLVLVLDPESGPGKDEVMRIFVSTLKGKTFNLEVNGSDTIRKVKYMIHDQGGPLVDKRRLIFKGKLLEDTHTVADYNIKTDSNLVIMSEHCVC